MDRVSSCVNCLQKDRTEVCAWLDNVAALVRHHVIVVMKSFFLLVVECCYSLDMKRSCRSSLSGGHIFFSDCLST